MRIVLTGGGTSAGHITPNLAVAHELKQLDPSIEIIYIGQRDDSLSNMVSEHASIDKTYSVRAGKLRRYHGVGLRQLLDIPTLAKNIRDAWRTLVSLFQSYWLLRRIKPDCVFIKGGYVGVPVGLAAAALHIPYVTHDSDALPGLANRIVAKWAAVHAVALSKEVYMYPPAKTVTVGVPVQANFALVTDTTRQDYKKNIGLSAYAKVILVTGGGQGARRLNDAIMAISPELLQAFPDLVVVIFAGQANEVALRQAYDKLLPSVQQKRVVVKGFASDFYKYSGAADIVVTRPGGTTMAEFAVQHKACVIIPNPFLTGGHQLKNAQYLEAQHAVLSVGEDMLQKDAHVLYDVLEQLLRDPSRRQSLGVQLGKLAHPNAAKELAMVLLEQAKK